MWVKWLWLWRDAQVAKRGFDRGLGVVQRGNCAANANPHDAWATIVWEGTCAAQLQGHRVIRREPSLDRSNDLGYLCHAGIAEETQCQVHCLRRNPAYRQVHLPQPRLDAFQLGLDVGR